VRRHCTRLVKHDAMSKGRRRLPVRHSVTISVNEEKLEERQKI
jgi:hypothetical protein